MPAALLGPEALRQIEEVVVRVLFAQNRLEPRPQNNRNHDEWQLPLQLGKTTTDHDKGATELVDLYGKPGDTLGSETKLTLAADGSDREIEVYNRFGDVADDKWVVLIDLGAGWELIAAEC